LPQAMERVHAEALKFLERRDGGVGEGVEVSQAHEEPGACRVGRSKGTFSCESMNASNFVQSDHDGISCHHQDFIALRPLIST